MSVSFQYPFKVRISIYMCRAKEKNPNLTRLSALFDVFFKINTGFMDAGGRLNMEIDNNQSTPSLL